jgi:hypothetical protein
MIGGAASLDARREVEEKLGGACTRYGLTKHPLLGLAHQRCPVWWRRTPSRSAGARDYAIRASDPVVDADGHDVLAPGIDWRSVARGDVVMDGTGSA